MWEWTVSMHEEITQQTPLMQQYATIKRVRRYVALFQVGDFYELFWWCKNSGSFLGIALTKRGKTAGTDIPLCGVPIHAFDHYVSKLVKVGSKLPCVTSLSSQNLVRWFVEGCACVYAWYSGWATFIRWKILILYCCFKVCSRWVWLFSSRISNGAALFTFINDAAIHRLEAELLRFFRTKLFLFLLISYNL